MLKRSIIVAGLGCLTAACGGDRPDFELTSDLPSTELIGEFADLTQTQTDIRSAGVSLARVKLERSNPGELLFTIPSTEDEAGSRFLMQFAEAENAPGKTTIRVTINVPSVKMGFNKELSESKVETYFQKHSRELVAAIGNGSSTRSASRELAELFDSVAMVTNPADQKKLEQAAQREAKGWDAGWHDEPPSDEEENSGSATADARPATKPGWEKPTWGAAR